MKKIALTALAAAAAMTAVAAPAAAQSYDRYRDHDRHAGYDRNDSRWEGRRDWDRGFRINQMQNQLDRRIDRGERSGRLTRTEARVLRRNFDEIVRLEARYRSNGLNRWERNDLERRLVHFESLVDRNLKDGQYAYRR